MALVAEVYTLHTFLLTLDLLLLYKWQASGQRYLLYLFSFLYGLGLTNHTSGILFVPGFAWILISSEHWRWQEWKKIAGMVGLFLVGLAPYLYFPIRASANPELNYCSVYYNVDLTTFKGVWWMVSAQAYRFFAFGYPWELIPGEIIRLGNYFWRNFLGVGVIVGFVGLISLWKSRRRLTIGLFLMLFVNLFFFINYRVIDKDTMILPVYLVWVIFVAVGFKNILRWIKKFVVYGLFHPIFIWVGNGLLISLIPIAVTLNWQWVDMSGVYGPELFARDIMDSVEPNSVVIAQWSSSVVLEYFQLVEGQRPDIEIFNRSRNEVARFYEMWLTDMPVQEILNKISAEEIQIVRRYLETRPVYVIKYDPLFANEFTYQLEGSYYRLSNPAFRRFH
jgi:hypothetical protein